MNVEYQGLGRKSRGLVPVRELSHHYIRILKNPPILDIVSRTRDNYIQFGNLRLFAIFGAVGNL
jgi:hypothetical protein